MIAEIVLGVFLGFAGLTILVLLWIGARARRAATFGRKGSVAVRSLLPIVVGFGGYCLGVLIVLVAFPTVPVTDPLLAVLSTAVPVAVTVYGGWLRSGTSRRIAFATALGPALAGAWLGFHVPHAPGVGALTAIVGATLAANLGLITVDIAGVAEIAWETGCRHTPTRSRVACEKPIPPRVGSGATCSRSLPAETVRLRCDRASVGPPVSEPGPITRLLSQVPEVPTQAEAQQGLRDVLADPTLDLLWMNADGAYVAADGRTITLEAQPIERITTPVMHEGRTVGALIHAPSVLEDPSALGEVTAVIGLAIEKDRINERLRRQRDLLSAIGDATPALLCVIFEGGQITPEGANQAIRDLVGATHEELAGQFFWEAVVAAEDRAEVERAIRDVVTGGSQPDRVSHWRAGCRSRGIRRVDVHAATRTWLRSRSS